MGGGIFTEDGDVLMAVVVEVGDGEGLNTLRIEEDVGGERREGGGSGEGEVTVAEEGFTEAGACVGVDGAEESIAAEADVEVVDAVTVEVGDDGGVGSVDGGVGIFGGEGAVTIALEDGGGVVLEGEDGEINFSIAVEIAGRDGGEKSAVEAGQNRGEDGGAVVFKQGKLVDGVAGDFGDVPSGDVEVAGGGELERSGDEIFGGAGVGGDGRGEGAVAFAGEEEQAVVGG